MSSSQPTYCQVPDVLSKLYSGQGNTSYGPDNLRDNEVAALCQAASRKWDQLTGRSLGGFAPIYEPRLFSGRGSQMLELDEFAALAKVEIDITPGRAPSWTDVTSDFTSGGLGRVLPNRSWPKTQLFRMSTFYVDPYRYGNVRVTAIWGCVQPDLAATTPQGPGPYFPPYNLSSFTSLQPTDAAGNNLGGWWITPYDVQDVIARWVVYMWKAAQAGYADAGGGAGSGTAQYFKSIPQFVKDVAEEYIEKTVSLAMITPDGIDIAEENAYGPGMGTPDSVSRWAGWMTSN